MVAGQVRAAAWAACLALACAGRQPATPPASTPAPVPGPAPEPAPAPTEPQPPAPPPPPDRTQPPWSQTPVAPVAPGVVEEEALARGHHLRLGSTRGSIHVWTPPGYHARTAGIVLYVHGYFTDVDQAFADHRLAEQFHESRRNALFVVAEAPAWNGEEVQWPDLEELLEEVRARTGLSLPGGPIVVAGHSGAIRVVLPWLLHPRVEELVLLDALYRGEDELAAWLAAVPGRRAVLVGGETTERTEAWLPVVPGARALPRIPRALGPAERRAPLVFLRSQYEHMALVTSGAVLPPLLAQTRLPTLAAASAAGPAPAPAPAAGAR